MSQNKLKLNYDKTEIILFGSKKHLAELNIKSLSVAGTDVSVASEPVRNLGDMFDSLLIMAPHVKSVVKKSSFGRVRPSRSVSKHTFSGVVDYDSNLNIL